MGALFYFLLICIIIYFLVINSIHLTILFLSIYELDRAKRSRLTFDLEQAFRFRLLPPVSIILPAYNEEKTIVESVRSLLFIHYPSYEVLVVNDGSTDGTLRKLKRAFNLLKTDYVFRRSLDTEKVKGIYISEKYKNIIVIDKENGGKADALNAGINVSTYPYFCAVDADTILGTDALSRLILPFINAPRQTTAVGGVVKPANGADLQMGVLLGQRLTRNILVNIQRVEYVRSFFMGRMGLSSINSLLIISGAFGLFKKDDVMAAGGYKKRSLGEDMMLVVKLHRLKKNQKEKYRIAFVPDTVCWTEIPSSLKVLKRQRIRWQMGLLESIFDNIRMFLNPSYGTVGLFSVPFYFFTEIISPFIEIAGYCLTALGMFTGVLPADYALHFLIATWVYGIVNSFMALTMEHYSSPSTQKPGHFLIKLLVSCVENLFYRQVNLYFRIAGFFRYFTKKREWGVMERKGFS
ncbi:MAG: glycosyltransferase family 2 protein [Spirochaetota bacterium]